MKWFATKPVSFCPKCNRIPALEYVELLDKKRYRVKCKNFKTCGLKAKWAKTETDAINQWEELVKKKRNGL